MTEISDARKPALLEHAHDLAEKLGAGPARGEAPVARNLLQSSLDAFLMGGSPERQVDLLRNLAQRGNPLHARSNQTGPQYRRLDAVVRPFLQDRRLTEAERRWVLGWAGRLLEVRTELTRRSGDDGGRAHGGGPPHRVDPRGPRR